MSLDDSSLRTDSIWQIESVQGSATSLLFTPPVFQNTWPCVQLLYAERNAQCQ